MLLQQIASLILILHTSIVIFIVSQFFLIPIGYKFGWNWQKKKNIRLLHLILISIVTLETCIGVACPLTIIENNLRGIYVSNSFVDSFFNKILYWDFPKNFFLITYLASLGWTIFMWFLFPPRI